MLKDSLANVAALAAQFSPYAKNRTVRSSDSTTDFDEAFRQLVLEVTEIDPADYHPDADLRADLSLDSLDLIELVMICEKDFHMIIPDRAWMSVKTIGGLYELVQTHKPRPTVSHEEETDSATGPAQ